MHTFSFTAYALDGELELNRLASNLGIQRRYRWEEPMVLSPLGFTPLGPDSLDEERVYLYFFGGVVFQNCTADMIRYFFDGMAKHHEGFSSHPNLRFHDDYSLRVGESETPSITNDYAVVQAYDQILSYIVCFVLAKSVALERIEARVDLVLDEMEGLIALLDQGKLSIPDRRLAKLASSILNFKYISIAHVMVLDKPDITWENPVADRFYTTMANIFELDQRYQEIKHKSETLMDITEVFTGLSHSRRAARLEWIIIILIAIEIVIYLFELFR